MTLKASTGLRNKILDTGSLKSLLAGGSIKMYGGTEPTTADAAIPGDATLLCTFTVNSTGTGITMAANSADGILNKNASEVWSGTSVGGVAAWYRHVAAGDTGAASTTEVRLQGKVANLGAEINLTNTTFASGATQTLDTYFIGLPTL